MALFRKLLGVPKAASTGKRKLSAAVPPYGWPVFLGQPYGGGFFAGQISSTGNGVATHNIVVCDASVGQGYKNWSDVGYTGGTGITSNLTGYENSVAIVALGTGYNSTVNNGAAFCRAINTGGYTDWYMPAKSELEVCYYHLKPNYTQNAVIGNVNAYAAFPRSSSSGYVNPPSPQDPVVTTATNFLNGASSQEFALGDYGSSTETSTTGNFRITFTTGDPTVSAKETANQVRAIRKVAI